MQPTLDAPATDVGPLTLVGVVVGLVVGALSHFIPVGVALGLAGGAWLDTLLQS